VPKRGARNLISGVARVHSIPDLQKRGVKFAVHRVPEDLCSVVELPTPGKASRYVAGFSNFEAITRYNRSTFYAMAVLDLAEAIRTERMRRVLAQAEGSEAPST
jgi:membrane-bound lytic murein transglycosylase B